jgi:hypothetical protein
MAFFVCMLYYTGPLALRYLCIALSVLHCLSHLNLPLLSVVRTRVYSESTESFALCTESSSFTKLCCPKKVHSLVLPDTVTEPGDSGRGADDIAAAPLAPSSLHMSRWSVFGNEESISSRRACVGGSNQSAHGLIEGVMLRGNQRKAMLSDLPPA